MRKQTNKHQIRKNIKKLLYNRDEIRAAFIYGSFADSDYYNDIDIAIYLKNDYSEETYFDYEFKLEKELNQKFNINFDIRIINKAPEYFQYNVFKNLCLFIKDEEILDLLENIVIKQMDENYFRNQYNRFLIEGISEEIYGR